MDSGASFCVAPQTWQDGLARYPPAHSQRWNTIPLRPIDLDGDFYNMISVLETRHRKNEFSDQDFKSLELTFSLLTANAQQYNLIPNGSEIRVTKSNAYEYFHRVHYAYAHTRPDTPMSPSSIPAVPVRLRSTTTGMRLTSQDIPAIEGLRWNACNNPAQLIFIPGEKLRWAVVPHSTDFMIRLQPDGENIVVEPDDISLFLNALHATIIEILRAIQTFGYYPPNAICAVPTELVEAAQATPSSIHPVAPSSLGSPAPAASRRVSSNGRSALYATARAAAAAAAAATVPDRSFLPSVSPRELEKQRALLSPTHDTGNILAPFQIMNM